MAGRGPVGTFVVPSVPTPTVVALGAAASGRGLDVVPLSVRGEDREPRLAGPVHLFGGPLLAARVQRLGPLVDPASELSSAVVVDVARLSGRS